MPLTLGAIIYNVWVLFRNDVVGSCKIKGGKFLNKRNIIIVGAVIVLVLTVFAVKNFMRKENESDKGTALLNQIDQGFIKLSLEEQYKYINDQPMPTMIVFSYDADCCESTKKFFDEYNLKARQLMLEYEDQLEVLFINTGLIASEEENEMLMKIANDYEVSTLPSILIRNGKGEKVKVIEGPFDFEEVKNVLNEVVKNEY
ncbi:MAG: hypothetical protein CVV02_04625 [Firmicutes bacterium HGW-Firmicutes-7]|nr:MAG: hypothetical protein CVV02_04625 [Firmicutes bacterium HGW-Firmicutes-7]